VLLGFLRKWIRKPAPQDHKVVAGDFLWVAAMKRVCKPWSESLEYVGWGNPEAAVVCFASAVRLEERRRLAALTPEELAEEFARDQQL
jgi:hypothetical protein